MCAQTCKPADRQTPPPHPSQPHRHTALQTDKRTQNTGGTDSPKQQQIQSFPSDFGSIRLTVAAGCVLLALSVAKSVVKRAHVSKPVSAGRTVGAQGQVGNDLAAAIGIG